MESTICTDKRNCSKHIKFALVKANCHMKITFSLHSCECVSKKKKNKKKKKQAKKINTKKEEEKINPCSSITPLQKIFESVEFHKDSRLTFEKLNKFLKMQTINFNLNANSDTPSRCGIKARAFGIYSLFITSKVLVVV